MEGPDPGQGDERGTEARNLGEHPLRATHHLPGPHVVRGLVPRADEAAVGVDAPLGEVGAQVPAPPAHGEVLTVVPDRVLPRPRDGTGRDVGGRGEWQRVPGIGTAINVPAPWDTILRVDFGKSWLPDRYGSLGSMSLQIMLLKPMR